MTAKASLCKAFLDGRVVNCANIFVLTSLTNCSRECIRMIEKPFGITLTRTERNGRSRYDSPTNWIDYSLAHTPMNKDGIMKMREYVNKESNGGTDFVKTPKTERDYTPLYLFAQ